ncbi:MAG: hypothetical protein ACRDNK_14135 [Solirubrobacteraceae bacterium]
MAASTVDGKPGSVLGQPGQLWIWSRGGQNLSVMGGDRPSPLALKGACDDGRSAALPAAADNLVDKLDQIIGEPNGDLLAHTNTVPLWDQLDPKKLTLS